MATYVYTFVDIVKVGLEKVLKNRKITELVFSKKWKETGIV